MCVGKYFIIFSCMKNHKLFAYSCYFLFIFLFSCTSEFGNKKLLSFKKVESNNQPILVKVLVSHESGYETSDYWNNYFIQRIDCKTGKVDNELKYTVDARNDKPQVLQITNSYVWLLHDSIKVIDMNLNKVFGQKETEKLIEQKNPLVKNKIAYLNFYGSTFLSLYTKQGDSYVVNLNDFSLVKANPKKYWTIPDSLNFYNAVAIKSPNIFAPNNCQRMFYQNTVYSLETDLDNYSKSNLYSYNLVNKLYQTSNDGVTSFTVLDSNKYYKDVDLTTKKVFLAETFLNASMVNLQNGNLFLIYSSELGDSAKKIFASFEVNGLRKSYQIVLPQLSKNEKIFGDQLFWGSQGSFFYGALGGQLPLHEYDIATGKLLRTY